MQEKLSVTNCNLSYKTQVLWHLSLCITVAQSEPEIIFDDQRFAELLAANCEMVLFNHRVIIRVHQR